MSAYQIVLIMTGPIVTQKIWELAIPHLGDGDIRVRLRICYPNAQVSANIDCLQMRTVYIYH